MSNRQAKKLRKEQRAAGVETSIERKRREQASRIAKNKEDQAALAKRIAEHDELTDDIRRRQAQRTVNTLAVAIGVIGAGLPSSRR